MYYSEIVLDYMRNNIIYCFGCLSMEKCELQNVEINGKSRFDIHNVRIISVYDSHQLQVIYAYANYKFFFRRR